MNKLRATRKRAPLAYPLVTLIAGLIIAKESEFSLQAILSMSFMGIAVLWFLSGRNAWYPCFLLCATCLFAAYGELRLPIKPNPQHLKLPPREVSLTIKVERVLSERSIYNTASGIARVIEAPPLSRLRVKDKLYYRIDLPEKTSVDLIRGQTLSLTGVLTALPETNTSERSFESYLQASDIHYRFDRTSDFRELRAPSALHRTFHGLNQQFQGWLQLGAPEGTTLSNVYLAMLLGRKAELSDAQRERYRLSGTMHFFAISGLHIGVIATVIAQTLKLLRVPHWLGPFIGLPLVYCYVEITGAAPSAVRALLMATFFWLSFAFQRQRSPFAALIGSAFFVLMIDPQQLWNVGFQLSYAVVLSILLLGLPFNTMLNRALAPFRWLPPDSWTWRHHTINQSIKALCLLFAISLSAWLASAPLSAAYFGFIAPGAIFLNMLLVNLASLVICGGVIALGCGLIQLTALTAFLNHSAWVCISSMDALVIGFTKIPGAIIQCERFTPSDAYSVLLLYFAGLLYYHYRPKPT